MSNTLKLGLSSKHYTTACLELLSNMGYNFDRGNDRSYLIHAHGNIKIDIFLLNTHDIPICLKKGYLDIGILQSAVLEEECISLKRLLDLKFGIGDMVIAVNEESSIDNIKDLNGRIVATRNPNLSKKFFDKHKIYPELFVTSKGTEVFPLMSDKISAMIEYRKSGETIKANKLKEIEIIMNSSLLLVSNKETELIIKFTNEIKEYFLDNKVPTKWISV